MPQVAGIDAMGEVHRLLTEHGKQELLRSDVDRRVLDAAAAYMAAEDGEIRLRLCRLGTSVTSTPQAG